MGGRNPKRNVAYMKQDEPSFLKDFKQRIGYEAGPDVDTKREVLPQRDSDEEEKDDEQPQVVVLRPGDLTREEAERLEGQSGAHIGPQSVPARLAPDKTEGKIVFKKPTKRGADEEDGELNVTSNKVKQKKRKASLDKEEKQSRVKGVKNQQLLSFGDDEEEEDV